MWEEDGEERLSLEGWRGGCVDLWGELGCEG